MRVHPPIQLQIGRPRINRARLNYWADVVAFAAGAVLFTAGLILLSRFHMGEGALHSSAFGIGRLALVNIYRLTAMPLVTAVSIHAYLQRRVIVA